MPFVHHPPAWPVYKTKFVDLTDFVTYEDVKVYDAKRNLSLVACSTHSIPFDSDFQAPITVLRGKPIGMTPENYALDFPEFWGYKILGRRTIRAVYSKEHMLEKREGGRFVLARVVGSDFKVLAGSRPLADFDPKWPFMRPIYAKLPDWAKPEIARWSTDELDPKCYFLEGTTSNSFGIEELVYFKTDPTPDFWRTNYGNSIFYIKRNDDRRLLQDCFDKKTPKYSLTTLAWVDPSGWFVVFAQRGDRKGLLWLWPNRPRNAA